MCLVIIGSASCRRVMVLEAPLVSEYRESHKSLYQPCEFSAVVYTEAKENARSLRGEE